MERPRMRISGPTIDARDGIGLAEFYERLLGWPIVERFGTPDNGWAKVRSPDGITKIEFQGLADYEAPAWPNTPGEQQMMIHLDITVEDLDDAVAWALECGARLAENQPRRGAHRVMLDPEGHPFCLALGTV